MCLRETIFFIFLNKLGISNKGILVEIKHIPTSFLAINSGEKRERETANLTLYIGTTLGHLKRVTRTGYLRIARALEASCFHRG